MRWPRFRAESNMGCYPNGWDAARPRAFSYPQKVPPLHLQRETLRILVYSILGIFT